MTQAVNPTPAAVAVATDVIESPPAEEKKPLDLSQQDALKAARPALPLAKPPVPRKTVDNTTSSSRGKEITCFPAVLRPNETLTIRTSKSFFQAAVSQANKDFFFLVSNSYPQGLVDQRTFQQRKTLEIRSDARIKPNQLVFTGPGIYTFYVSMNMESDDGTPRYSCKVQFLAK